MDLSGIIFVALAIGWAVYLIPKALQREDEKALSRPVESFSDSLRVLGHRSATAAVTSVEPAPAEAPATKVVYQVSRKAAADAARRRRRVLGVLLVALLATVGTSYFVVTPWWSTAVPATMIVAFLVVARITVKASRRVVVPVESAPAVPLTAEQMQPDLGAEATSAVSREELAAAVAAPTTDAGGLWDPLPVTLPTYVNKARARRTVRTIELTGQGVTSSGHSTEDSKIAEKHDEQRPAAGKDEAPAKKVSGA